MATNCRACDRQLLMIRDKKNAKGELEDLCGLCRSASFAQYNYLNDHRYVLQDAQDGDVSHPHDCSGL